VRLTSKMRYAREIPSPTPARWGLAVLLCWMSNGDFTRTLAATVPETSFLEQSWLAPDGLPQSTVRAIAQTEDGYLWVGTAGGLARFDGVSFTSFGLAEGLKSLAIQALASDGLGGLWIGTAGGGLSRWQSGKITTLTDAEGLAHNYVMDLASAEPGGVWIGTKRGLQHLGSLGLTQVGWKEGLGEEVVSMAADHQQGVWVAVEPTGLFHVRGDHCERVEGPPNRRFHGHALLVDSEGDLWMSIGGGKVLRRHHQGWTEYDEQHGLPHSFVYCLAQGAPGEIWAGTQEAGLVVFRDGRFQPVPTADDSIRSLRMSRDGLVWAGTRAGGLSRLTPRKLQYYPVGSGQWRGQVNGLVEESPDCFWVGTYGGGLHRGPLDQLEHVLDGPALGERPFFTAALRMRDGTLCFAGARSFYRVPPGRTNSQVIKTPETITSLLEAANGSLLLATREGELFRLEDDQLKPLANGSFPVPVSALARGPGPAVWVATQGAGLFLWQAGHVQRWTVAEGLPTEVLNALYTDQAGTLWIGTAGGGLAWMEGSGIHFLDVRQGLVDNFVSQILEDEADNLWLGGQRGIFRVSKQEIREVVAGRAGAVHPFALDESDGLPIPECASGYSPSGLRGSSGTLYFSTMQGVAAVEPATFTGPSITPKVLIEDVTLGGRPVHWREGHLQLPPGSRDLEIRYTAFNFAKPEQIRFRHRFEGRNSSWVDAGRQRSTRFSQLPPGDYRFQATAANQDGHWNETAATLAFTVLPFFWETSWFRFLGLTAVVGGSSGLVWWSMRNKLRRHREELKLHRQRAEIAHSFRLVIAGELAASIAHEINQPLGAILSNADAAEMLLTSRDPDLDEIRQILTDIRKDDVRASEVIQRVRALLRKRDTEMASLDFNAAVSEVQRLIEVDARRREVGVSTELGPGLPPVVGDKVQLQQVLLNLTVNGMDAMCGTPTGHRRLSIRTRHTWEGVEVSVTDAGHGIPPDQLSRVFESYHTTKKDGMGLGLSIARSIIETHHGRIWAENDPAGGATFRFVLPAQAGVEPHPKA